MLFFEITTVEQITEIIGHNANDTVAEIVNFNVLTLAISLMDRLKRINHFAFHNVIPEALNLFIVTIGMRYANALPDQQALTIELGENETLFAEDIKKILAGYGLNLDLIRFVLHEPRASKVNVSKLPLLKSDQEPHSPQAAETSQLQLLATPYPVTPISAADKTIYESPLSPRSPRYTDGDEIELQDFSSDAASNNQPLLPGITDSDLTLLTENLKELNGGLTSVVKNLEKLQLENSAHVQRYPLSSSNSVFSEEEQKNERDFLNRSRLGMPQSNLPRSHAVDLAAIAVENRSAFMPYNQTGQREKESSAQNGNVPAPSIPPLSKQAIPTAEGLAKVRTWWHEQLAKPPRKPPPRLEKVLRELQNEERKKQKLPLIDWAAIDEKEKKEKEKEATVIQPIDPSVKDKEVNEVPQINRSAKP